MAFRYSIIITLLLVMTCFAQGEEAQMSTELYTDQEKQYMIDLARATLSCYLRDGSKPRIDESSLPDKLKEKRGCFVTLNHRRRGLRGCIGYILPVSRLIDNIRDRALDAALHDPRFNPVTYQELDDILIEISILTVPEERKFASAQELLDTLEPMRHGVVLKTPYGSSTYLPQVWEQLPDKELFLDSLCAKHGAPRDIWRKTDSISVSLYEAIVFHEEVPGRIIVGNNGATVGADGATIVGKVEWGAQDMQPQKLEPGTEIEALTILGNDSDVVFE